MGSDSADALRVAVVQEVYISHPCLLHEKQQLYVDRFAMSHDSYTCRKFPDTTAFPTKRESGVGNYVGSVVRDICFAKTTNFELASSRTGCRTGNGGKVSNI